MKYMENCFSDNFWNDLGPIDDGWFARAQIALDPTSNKYPNPAVAMKIQFSKSEEQEAVNSSDSESEREKNIKLSWNRKNGWDRTNFGSDNVWSRLTPVDKLWVRGKGARLIDVKTGVETTGEITSDIAAETRGRGIAFSKRKNFADLPKSSSKKHPRSESEIEYIVLDQDVHLESHQMETEQFQKLHVIRVQYRPRESMSLAMEPTEYLSSTRKRNRLTTDDETGTWKKLKINFWTFKESVIKTVGSIFEEWSIQNLEKSFTHQTASEWCQTSGINFGRYFNNAQWQLEKLNYEKEADKYLIEHIRYWVFMDEQTRYEGSSPDDVFAFASIQLKQELLSSVPNWGPQTCEVHCKAYKIDDKGYHEEVLARIIKWFKDDIRKLIKKYPGLIPQNDGFGGDFDFDQYDFNEDKYSLFKSTSKSHSNGAADRYIRDYQLQDWGNTACKRERVARHIFAGNHKVGSSRDVPEITSRTLNGVETYLFTCNLDSTSIRSLHSSLFIEGLFPYDAELTLWRGNQVINTFENEDDTLATVLSHHPEGSFVDFQLQVTSSDNLAGKRAQTFHHPPIYIPRNTQSVTANRYIDPALWRRANVVEGGTVATFRERWQMVQDFSGKLEKALCVNGGRDVLRPYKTGVRSTSGAEILDNLQGVMEAEADFLEVRGIGGDDLIDISKDQVLKGFAGSDMAALYRELEV
jgi:hypothetical protein